MMPAKITITNGIGLRSSYCIQQLIDKQVRLLDSLAFLMVEKTH